jgi:AraC-like DNA-binding protein
MYFSKTQPRFLKKEVRFFYSIKMNTAQGDSIIHRRLPDGTLDIVFNLHKPVSISKDGERFELMPDIALTGLYTDKCIMKYDSDIYLIGAVLQPGYAHLFVNDSLEHHKAATQNATEILDSKLLVLLQQMHTAVDEQKKHCLLERFLLSRLKRVSNSYTLNNIHNALVEIHESSGAISINNLCKKHFMSERNFRRKFIEYVGISPKKYAAIVRIKAFCLLHQSGIGYNDCINYLEFTDQSHLHKEFHKIAGTNPEHFFKQMNVISERFLHFI